jgi:hypothetical protein
MNQSDQSNNPPIPTSSSSYLGASTFLGSSFLAAGLVSAFFSSTGCEDPLEIKSNSLILYLKLLKLKITLILMKEQQCF